MNENELRIIFLEIFKQKTIQESLKEIKNIYNNQLNNIRDDVSQTINEKIYRIAYPEKSPNITGYNFINISKGYNCKYILGDNINYKEEIQKIIDNDTSKKAYSKMIKNNFTLWEEILDKTENVITSNISLRIYCYMNDIKTNKCKNGNYYGWKEPCKSNGKNNFSFCKNHCKCSIDKITLD